MVQKLGARHSSPFADGGEKRGAARQEGGIAASAP
jgi:hypothetical protein